MKGAVWLLLAAPCMWAGDQAADRAAIVKLVASLNNPTARPDAGEVWTEMSHPMMVIRSVQFLSSKVALVEAARVQYGSITIRREPVVIWLERKRGRWTIISVRVRVEPAPAIPFPFQPIRFLPQ